MQLLIALRSEMLKTKRTASFFLTLAGAVPVPLILLVNVLTGGADLDAIRKDPLSTIFALGMERNGLIFFPVFVILVCTLLPQIEYRNHTWKQVIAAPQTKGNLFLAKFLSINLLILLFLVAHLVYLSLAAVVIHFFNPALDMFRLPFDATPLLTGTANAYVAMLALCAFQFWLGLRFRNFIIPIAIGFGLWLAGMMMVFAFQSGLVEFFPYSFQTFPFIPQLQPKMAQAAWTSVGFAALFLLLAFFDFRRRRFTF